MCRTLILDCPVHGFDCALDAHDGVAAQSVRGGPLEARNERAASNDELLTQASQLLDLGHDSHSDSGCAKVNEARTIGTTGARFMQHFAAGNWTLAHQRTIGLTM
jgi:hypothetical protein